jgi:hypothetical protein
MRTHNETPSVVSMRVSNEDRAPARKSAFHAVGHIGISYRGKNRGHRPLARPIRPKGPAIRIVFSSGGNRGRVAFFLFGRVPAFFPLRRFLPFGDCAKHRSRSRDAVIRVYDEAGNVIETHEHKGDFKEW